MHVFGAHLVGRLELCWRWSLATELAADHDALDVIDRKLAALWRFCGFQCMSLDDFVRCEKTLVDEQVFETEQPFLVVGAGEIDMWWQGLAIEAGGVDVEGASRPQRAHQRQ